MKKISISLTDYAFERLLGNFQGNISKRLEYLALIGDDAIHSDINNFKKQIFDRDKEIIKLNKEIDTQRKQIVMLQNQKGLDKQLTDGEKIVQAIKNRGLF